MKIPIYSQRLAFSSQGYRTSRRKLGKVVAGLRVKGFGVLGGSGDFGLWSMSAHVFGVEGSGCRELVLSHRKVGEARQSISAASEGDSF